MNPQQPSATVNNTTQPPGVVIMSQTESRAYPKDLPLKTFHFVFGIIQIVIAFLMFVIAVAAVIAHVPYTTFPGIYCSVLVFIAGLLSILGARLENRPLIIACMILNILASVACFIGICFASHEVGWYALLRWYLDRRSASTSTTGRGALNFGYGKAVFMVIFCVIEFVLTIIHASLSCRSVCSCCAPRSTSGPNETVAYRQQGIPYQTAYPAQPSLQYPQQAVMPQGTAYFVPQQQFGYVGPQQPQQTIPQASNLEQKTEKVPE